MRRRNFIALLGSAAAWPLVARAQQAGKLPTIGYLGSATPATQGQWVAAFVERLRELGWIDGRNVTIEYRWGEGRDERFAEMFNASTPDEIEFAFASIASRRPDALLVGTDAFLLNRRDQIVSRVASLRLPAIYPFRDYAASGGLISFGTNIASSYRQAGIYAGRILKGDKAADLPVMQPTVFEFVINSGTANKLGLAVPAALYARSDEIIE